MNWDLRAFMKAACKKIFEFWYRESPLEIRRDQASPRVEGDVGHEANSLEGRFDLGCTILPH